MAIDSTSFSALAQQAVLRSDESQVRSLKVENFQQAVSFVRTLDANERAYGQAPVLTQGQLRPTGDEFHSSTPFISAYTHLVFDRDGSAYVDAIESGQVDTGQIVDEMQSGKSLIELADEFGLTVDELRTELENAGYDVKMSLTKAGWKLRSMIPPDELRAQIEQEKLFVIYSHEADGGVGYTIRMNDGSFVMSYTTSQFLLPS